MKRNPNTLTIKIRTTVRKATPEESLGMAGWYTATASVWFTPMGRIEHKQTRSTRPYARRAAQRRVLHTIAATLVRGL